MFVASVKNPGISEEITKRVVPDDYKLQAGEFEIDSMDQDVHSDEYRSAMGATQYQRDRVNGTDENPVHYAPLEEQEDMKYWDAINGTTTWIDHIAAVKNAHPKPEES